jgi:aminoglycoside/choline kinase family phosphotransferase
LRSLPPAPVAALNPALDEELMRRELDQTLRVYLEPQGLAGEGTLAGDLGSMLASICAELGAAPAIPCHRDFMARNLVPVPSPAAEVAVLDHQDLRLGPPGYDLASLLNDSLFPPFDIADRLRRAAGVAERDYRLAAVQRTLKAVGTFAAFAARGSPRHLPLIGPTLRRCLENLEALPEGSGLATRLRRLWHGAIC